MRLLILATVVVCALVNAAHAWSSKEHIQLTRLAATRLLADPTTPPAMKEWLKKHVPGMTDMAGERDYLLHTRVGQSPTTYGGILRYATRPDDHQTNDPQGSQIPVFNVHEKQMHFIDLEFFLPGDAKREYRSDLSARPKIEDIPNNIADPRYIQAGFLPLRVEYCYGKLVDAMRNGRLDGSTQMLESEEDSAVRWAGYIAHYLEDNTQPQHATVDYQSASYFSNKRKAPKVHPYVEYKMIDDPENEHAALRAEFWPLFENALAEVHDPVTTDDPFRGTLEVAFASYEALPMIGDAAVAALVVVPGNKPNTLDVEAFFRHIGTYQGKQMSVMQMKANQLAWAVKRVERLWRRAWDGAHAPTPATSPAATR